MTRPRARKRASKNCVRKAARAYTHAHLPQARRYSFTPELMADGRRRYEQTAGGRSPSSPPTSASTQTTFQRLANREGWLRYVPPPRDLPAAAEAGGGRRRRSPNRHPSGRASGPSKG